MKNYVKFLQKLPLPLRLKLIETVGKIALYELKDLDIKPLQGKKGFYRCRIGKIRIIFEKQIDENVIFDIGFRGDIYKK